MVTQPLSSHSKCPLHSPPCVPCVTAMYPPYFTYGMLLHSYMNTMVFNLTCINGSTGFNRKYSEPISEIWLQSM